MLDILSIAEEIKQKLEDGSLSLEINGHFDHTKESKELPFYFQSYFVMDMFKLSKSFNKEEKEYILTLLKKVLNGEPVNAFPILKIAKHNGCSNCQEEFVLWIDHEKVFTKDFCSVMKRPIEVMIPVPSGKLVVENDLREYFTESNFNVNTFHGTKQTTVEYAEEHFFHAFVGNSCPGYKYLDKDEQSGLFIGQINEEDEDTFDIIEDPDSLGYICTDLWWFSIVDLEILKKRAEMLDLSLNLNSLEVIDIKPGMYKSTSFFPITGYDNKKYATMEYVGEVDTDIIDDIKIKRFEDKDDGSIMKHWIIERIEEEEYANLRPSLSTLLWDNSFTLETSKKKENWFPYEYSEHKTGQVDSKGHDIYTGYMTIVKGEKDFLNILDDKEFFESFPLFDKDYFMLSKPESHFKYHSLDWYPRENTFPWAAAYYPYDEDVRILLLNILFAKSMLEYRNTESMFEHFHGEDSEPELVTEKLYFTMNMAYTNIVERNLKHIAEELILEIKENWESLKGFSNGLKKEMKSDLDFLALKREYIFGFEDGMTKERFIEERLERLINTWPEKANSRGVKEKLQEKLKELQ